MPQTNPCGISTLLCSFITYYLRAHLARGVSGLPGRLAGGPSPSEPQPRVVFGRAGIPQDPPTAPNPQHPPSGRRNPQEEPQLPQIPRPVAAEGSRGDFIQGLVVKIENGRGEKEARTTITKKQLAIAPESAVWSDPPSLPPPHQE